jgi:hypothetical protein
VLALLLALPALAPDARAWGERGHRAVGVLAIEQASKEARLALAELLGDLNWDTVGDACHWPDVYRALGEQAAWSAPLHYVNIDPAQRRYDAGRDCPDGQCLPAATVRYAGRLGDPTLGAEDRREAFAFLCHFTGDLHQPLHVGFAEDRGGNRIDVVYEGETINLHWFWDGALIRTRTDSWQDLAQRLRERPQEMPGAWRPGDIPAWTNESFTFTRNFAYPAPDGRELTRDFTERSWRVVLHQLDTASARLAAILDAVLAPDGAD